MQTELPSGAGRSCSSPPRRRFAYVIKLKDGSHHLRPDEVRGEGRPRRSSRSRTGPSRRSTSTRSTSPAPSSTTRRTSATSSRSTRPRAASRPPPTGRLSRTPAHPQRKRRTHTPKAATANRARIETSDAMTTEAIRILRRGVTGRLRRPKVPARASQVEDVRTSQPRPFSPVFDGAGHHAVLEARARLPGGEDRDLLVTAEQPRTAGLQIAPSTRRAVQRRLSDSRGRCRPASRDDDPRSS